MRLTIAEPFLVDLRRRLRSAPGALTLPAGVSRQGERVELLLPGPVGARAQVRVFFVAPGLQGISHLYWHGMGAPRVRAGIAADLALLEDRGCSAAAFVDGAILPVEQVMVMGRTMERWVPAVPPRDLAGTVPARGPFSRYMGALGGSSVHSRLRAIGVTGIGAARLGSAMAMALAKAGVHRLHLCDPDVLEDHSQDAVECFPQDTGGAKVVAVARLLQQVAPWCEVRPLRTVAASGEALAACRDSEVVFSAPDQDEARLGAAMMATALHRVHLDLGTSVRGEGREWRAGADVRLVVPGQGCLACVGGLDLRQGRPADWRRQRAGSLRSLNHLAVSTVMGLVERLVAGGLAETTWLRVEVAPDGAPAIQRMPWDRDPACPLCSRWAGAGDEAFGRAANEEWTAGD